MALRRWPVADRWFVEVVIDTGQRYQTVDLRQEAAQREVDDLRSRARVIAVTMIQVETGECFQVPSRNLMASCWPRGSRRGFGALASTMAREALAEAFGDAA